MPFILSVLELYDRVPFYKMNLGRIIKDAQIVIACEINRARIMKSWWKLNQLPYVMPNKSYIGVSDLAQYPVTKRIEDAILKIKGRKCLMYQGLISSDRDITLLAKALKKMNSDYLLVLTGKDVYNGVDNLKRIYDNTIYLGYFPAPSHLFITQHAHIGVAYYDDSSLNNLFCAPNKIYEFAGFGIPTLGNDVPGLIYSIGLSRAGVCVNFNHIESIINALNDIETNYSEYSRNAINFFNTTDNLAVMREIVNNVFE